MGVVWLALVLSTGAAQLEATFLTGPREGPPLAIARQYLDDRRQALGLTSADLDDVVVSSQDTSAHTGVTHIYLRQRYRGIDVVGADVNFNIARDGRIISMGGGFVGNLAAAANTRTPANDAVTAARAAARHLDLGPGTAIRVSRNKGGPAHEMTLTGGGVSEQPIPAKLVFQPVASKKLRLAWQLEIQEPGGQHWWVVTVDAASLLILDKVDRVKSDGSPS